MARNTVPIIIGAVLFGLLAIGLTFYSLLGGGSAPAPNPGADGTAAEAPQTSNVFVARRAIYPRTVITRDMIEETEADASGSPNAITNPYDVVGRLANRTIQAGQILTSDAITTGLGRVIPANIAIPAGLRGVAIWVNPDQTAAGLVDVGDRVDVIATHELTIEKAGNQVVVGATEFTSGRTIAQDVEVLAVDRSITEMRPSTPAPSANGAAPGADGQPGAAPTPAPGQPGGPPAAQQPAPPPGQERRTRVILAASPEIAQRLVAADAKGDLHITIRNPVARDRFPLAEAREYPSRVAAGPAPSTPAAAGGGARRTGGGGGDSFARSEPIMPPPSFPSPAPQPLPPFAPSAGTPVTAPVPEKDVTVIRGTEKTRVIVPR